METTITIKAKLSTVDEITIKELKSLLLDTSQVSNIITYDIIEKEIEEVNE